MTHSYTPHQAAESFSAVPNSALFSSDIRATSAPIASRRSGFDRRVNPPEPPAMSAAEVSDSFCDCDEWERRLETEEKLRARHTRPYCILVVAPDGADVLSEEEICRLGRAIRAAMKRSDVVARVSKSRFAILAADCDCASSAGVLQRLRGVLNRAGASASLGLAVRLPANGLKWAWQQADRSMLYRVP